MDADIAEGAVTTSGDVAEGFLESDSYRFLFIICFITGVALSVALVVYSICWKATNNPGGYSHISKPSLSTLILLCYTGLYILGYYCHYLKTTFSNCQRWFFGCGFGMVLFSWMSLIAAYTVENSHLFGFESDDGKKIMPTVITIILQLFQLIALVGFIVCATKQHCFGKCITTPRIVFYAVGILTALWLLGCFGAYTIKLLLKLSSSGTGGKSPIEPLMEITIAIKDLMPINFIILIALSISAYQINLCCVPWSECDLVFIMMTGITLGLLLTLIISAHDSKTNDHNIRYTLACLVNIATILLLVLIHFKEPLSQYWAKDRLACGILSLLCMLTWLGVAGFNDNEISGKPWFYCLVVYGLITFVGALYYGFRSGLVKDSMTSTKKWFTKKCDSKKLQGSEKAPGGAAETVENTDSTVGEAPEAPGANASTDDNAST
ncbi:putative integral membrane protein [Babesia bovis T2Bo]|uniref:Uncharacterized protein n=1 Tax=Babesia bovis TaxID=5865 RepID=A7AUV1_BABBO|nr:putative integral membrane protein [Babesia bovis T2Bo]EDO06712.1 putative integral membrane protein [Babesia bovis T2Bo]|eukprot:XP_001610280.1 hypothetical protein [Babesia bovis T2Bo]